MTYLENLFDDMVLEYNGKQQIHYLSKIDGKQAQLFKRKHSQF